MSEPSVTLWPNQQPIEDGIVSAVDTPQDPDLFSDIDSGFDLEMDE